MDRPAARARAAFTLVELLVVHGIVAVVLGITLPAVFSVREHARVARCTANVHVVTQSLLTHAFANQSKFPVNTSFTSPGRYWYDADQAGAAFPRNADDKPAGGFLACPSDEGGGRSYATNFWASGRVDAAALKGTSGTLWDLRAPGPSRLVLVVESWSYTGRATTGWLAQATAGRSGRTAGQRFGGGGGVPAYTAGRFDVVNCDLAYGRHRGRGGRGDGTQPFGRVNIGYADGHVALASDADLVDGRGVGTGHSTWYPDERP